MSYYYSNRREILYNTADKTQTRLKSSPTDMLAEVKLVTVPYYEPFFLELKNKGSVKPVAVEFMRQKIATWKQSLEKKGGTVREVQRVARVAAMEETEYNNQILKAF